jgi:LysR family glycine cleavage system transcriptional activator
MLEAELGVRLFERKPRGLVLTEVGRDYFVTLDPAWETMTRATANVRQRGRRTSVTVSVMPTFAANWLIPRLPRFQAQHKAIEIDVQTSPRIEDFAARPELDCAIRLGRGPWPGLACEPLLAVHACPVASPQLLADGRYPRHPHDLLDHRLIGTDHQIEFWQEWFAANGLNATPEHCVAFDNLQVVYEAAAAGIGIALGLDPVVQPFLDSGRLRPLFAERVRLPRQFHLVRRIDRATPRHGVAEFRDWLVAEAAMMSASPSMSKRVQ